MLSIRPIVAADQPAWRALWHDYLAFYATELPEEIYRTTFARLIDPDVTDQAGLIAERDGEAVGLVHYIFHRHGWKIEEVCYLQDLYVAPAARGLGAGRALMQGVFAAADSAGRPEVYWLTQTFNATARRLYDDIGTLTPFIKYRRPGP